MLDGVHYNIQDGDQNSFRFKLKFWFPGRAGLIKKPYNIIGHGTNVLTVHIYRKFERKQIY